MNIICLDKTEIAKYQPSPGSVLIQIKDRGEKYLPVKAHYDDRLETFFLDTEEENFDDPNVRTSIEYSGETNITPEIADTLVRFIAKNRKKDFVISCSYGESRSIAVGHFIKNFIKKDAKLYAMSHVNISYYNQTTYRYLKDALRRLIKK